MTEPLTYPDPAYPREWQVLHSYTKAQLEQVYRRYACAEFYRYAPDFLTSARKAEQRHIVRLLLRYVANTRAVYQIEDDEFGRCLRWLSDKAKDRRHRSGDALWIAARIWKETQTTVERHTLSQYGGGYYVADHGRRAMCWIYHEWIKEYREQQAPPQPDTGPSPAKDNIQTGRPTLSLFPE